MSRLLAAAAVIGLLFATPASAQTADTAPFIKTCSAADPAIFGLGAGIEMNGFCGCVAGELSSRPQADIDILLSDLEGTSTEATHAAHGSYEAVEEVARDAVEKCAANSTETTGLNRTAPDMTGFDANCRASARLKAFLSGAPKGPDAALESACSCVSAELSIRFSQSVVDFLGEQLAAADPSATVDAATEEQNAAGRDAEQVMGQCVTAAAS